MRCLHATDVHAPVGLTWIKVCAHIARAIAGDAPTIDNRDDHHRSPRLCSAWWSCAITRNGL